MDSTAHTPAPRRQVRTPFPVELVRDGKQRPCFLGYGANVSETGVFVQCSNPRETGAELRVRLHLPTGGGGEATLVESDGEVIWWRGWRGRSHAPSGMGVQLRSIEIGSAVALQQFCTGETQASTVTVADPIRIGLPDSARRTPGTVRFRIWARAREDSAHRQFWVLATDLHSARELARAGIGPGWDLAQVERCDSP